MADKPSDKTLLPGLLHQNPSPWKEGGQDRKTRLQEQVDRVMGIFRQLIPSNYVSRVAGPWYMTQFQTIAERLAEFQITAQEVFADNSIDYTRPEVLYQIIGDLVFPEAESQGYPTIEGDLTYREFLENMVALLLGGSTTDGMQAGIELLTTATVEIIERGRQARLLGSNAAWGASDAHVDEINISQEAATITVGEQEIVLYRFPEDPFILHRNVRLVLRALKPGHVIYQYRHLFQDTFATLFTESSSWSMDSYYYQDLRRYWFGATSITGTAGITWAGNRSVFSDHTRDFSSIRAGAALTVTSGVNSVGSSTTDESYVGRYQVSSVLAFLQDDTTARAYTTSPTVLSGTATISGDEVTDTEQTDWATVEEGEILTFAAGPNAGSYRIKDILGLNGGPAGFCPSATGTSIRVAPSILRLRSRMGLAATGQSYEVAVDRLGVQAPRAVTEDVTEYFLGPGVAKDTFSTRRGPLVKDWGDMTPATKNDVTVLVDGGEVVVESVNPFTGLITLVDAIGPYDPADPGLDVRIVYNWFPTPVLPLAELNLEGAVLGQWDIPLGHHSPAAHGDQVQDATHPKGAVGLSRFPMCVVLGPVTPLEPLLVSHRYLGFEKSYSALLNSPTTLQLNQSPWASQVPGFDYPTAGVSIAYEGDVLPAAATNPWTLIGVDAGGLNSDGTITVSDAVAAAPEPGVPNVAMYQRAVDLSFPASVYVVGRMDILDYDLSGVFTGVTMGIHDNHHLYLMGALVVDSGDAAVLPVKMVGMLTDATRPDLLASWEVGPSVSGDVTETNVVTLTTTDIPIGVEAETRFQILTGSQAGVYVVSSLTAHSDGTTDVTVAPVFPADYKLYGNKSVTVVFESWGVDPNAVGEVTNTTVILIPTTDVPAAAEIGSEIRIPTGTQAGTYTITGLQSLSDGNSRLTVNPAFPADYVDGNQNVVVFLSGVLQLATYRLVVDPDLKTGTVMVSGAITGTVASLSGETSLPNPADAGSLFPTDDVQGRVWWGSMSPLATSDTAWTFLRYGVVPDQTAIRGFSSSVSTDMTVLPEADSPEWYLDYAYGYSKIDTGLLLKSTAGMTSAGFSYEYKRIEPYATPFSSIDLRGELQVQTGTCGSQDGGIIVTTTERQVVLGTLLYDEDVGQTPYRQLLDMPVTSMSAEYSPLDQGWAKNTVAGLEGETLGRDLVLAVEAEQAMVYTSTVDSSQSHSGWVLEGRMAVDLATADPGWIMGLLTDEASLYLKLTGPTTPKVQLVKTDGDVVVQEYTLDWTDEALHSFRLVESAGVITVFLDDTVQVPTLTTADFVPDVPPSPNTSYILFGTSIVAGGVDVTTRWRSAALSLLPPAGAKRTFGIWTGGVQTDIDNWEIPRTDTSSAANSVQVGPVIEEMDWRVSTKVRLLWTPGWGVTMFLPDEDLPPYYDLEQDGVAGTGYIHESNQPSAGWINVEQPHVPLQTNTFGGVTFGALNPNAVTQQKWADLRYTIFREPSGDHKSPEHMILNQFNVITSGEMLKDFTLESESIQVVSTTVLNLRPCHINAEDVYTVVDGSSTYDRSYWTFDKATQTVTMGDGFTFSSATATVTVFFIPSKPVTNTYLQKQPLLDGVTVLNEGTPPVPKGQVAEASLFDSSGTLLEVEGALINDPTDPLDKVVAVQDDPDALYENMEFIEVTNSGLTGLITTISEGQIPAGATGYSAIEGETVYSPDGEGDPLGGVGCCAGLNATDTKVGAVSGGHALGLKGTAYWEQGRTLNDHGLSQVGGMPGGSMTNGLCGPVATGLMFCNNAQRGTPGPGPVVNGMGAARMTLKDTETGEITSWLVEADPPL